MLQQGVGVVVGKNVRFGENVAIWNYTVIQDNCMFGDNVVVGSFCDIGKDVHVGKNSVIQAHCTISNQCKIGENVFIGPNTTLLNDRFPHSSKLRPVVICDKVVVGGGVIVLPDVIIKEGAVVAGAAVVTRDVEADTVVKTPGLPARPFMDRHEFDKKKLRYETGPNKVH